MNISFDTSLSNIKELKWLPWIGKSYGITPENAALIIGESHYVYEAEDEDTAQYFDGNTFTRGFVKDNILDNPNKPMRIVRNIERCLYNERYPTESKKLSLWDKTAFMNFVQREMTDGKARPNDDDFKTGWRVFFQVLQILEPKYCLFAGVTASTYEPYYLEIAASHGFDASHIIWSEGIGGSNFGRTTTLSRENYSTQLVFIKHPSSFFSWSKWNAYLSTQIPNYIKSLQSIN